MSTFEGTGLRSDLEAVHLKQGQVCCLDIATILCDRGHRQYIFVFAIFDVNTHEFVGSITGIVPGGRQAAGSFLCAQAFGSPCPGQDTCWDLRLPRVEKVFDRYSGLYVGLGVEDLERICPLLFLSNLLLSKSACFCKISPRRCPSQGATGTSH